MLKWQTKKTVAAAAAAAASISESRVMKRYKVKQIIAEKVPLNGDCVRVCGL